MFVSKSLLPLFLAASLASPALAGPLADAARKAEEQAAAGDPVGAHNTIRDAFGAFAATLPFTIGKAVFVAAPPGDTACMPRARPPTSSPAKP